MNSDYYPKDPDELPRRHRGVEPSTYAPTFVEASPGSSGITEATAHLDNSLGKTTELLGALLTRLQPVLCADDHPREDPNTNVVEKTRNLSEHAQALENLAHGVDQLGAAIDVTLSRLDLPWRDLP